MRTTDFPVVQFRTDGDVGHHPESILESSIGGEHQSRHPDITITVPDKLVQLAWSLSVLSSYVKYSGLTHTSYKTVTLYTSTSTSTVYSGTATYALSGTCIPPGVATC